MSVLIISATKMEIQPFMDEYPDADVLISGVGAPVTIYSLSKKLFAFRYELVIQAGIAGTFDDQLQIGETVMVKQDRFADVGLTEKGKFTSVFESGLANGNSFPFKNGWLENETEFSVYSNCRMVNGITVNTVSDVFIPFDFSLKNTIESMEGAALHYVGNMEKIRFLQLRSISNKAGDRNKSNWKIKEAINSLNTELISVYKKMR